MSTLQKIADITLAGKPYELASNSKAYLISNEEKDAYGKPIAKIISVKQLIADDFEGEGAVQGLLDLLVSSYRSLKSSRDSILGKDPDEGRV